MMLYFYRIRKYSAGKMAQSLKARDNQKYNKEIFWGDKNGIQN